MKKDSNLTVAGAKQVNDSIRVDLRAGRLDITVAAASGVEGDKGEDENDEDMPQADEDMAEADEDMAEADEDTPQADGDMAEADEDTPQADGDMAEADEDMAEAGEDIPEGDEDIPEDDEDIPEGDEDFEENDEDQEEADVPKVPIWYRNAVMKKMWEKASPSQKDNVEQWKIVDESKMEELAGDEADDEMDDQQKVTRLEEVLRFVTCNIPFILNFGTHLSQHVAVAQVLNVSLSNSSIRYSKKRGLWGVFVWLVQTLRKEGS
jgi:hypothetical protein